MSAKLNFKGIVHIIKDYIFLVLVFFILRLYGITDPPLEIQHSWRQCTGLMIARNFLHIDANILYPRIDDLCSSSDIVAFEFQLLSYLHYLVSLIFGYEHWYGRMINLFISSLGTLSFGFLINRFSNSKIAWFSVFCLLASNWLIFSRKMMPDTFSISLVLISLYFSYRYFKEQKFLDIFFFFIFFTLGGLTKIPAVIYGSIIFIFYFKYKDTATRNLLLVTLLSLIIVFIWYFIWGPFISSKYGNWTNLGKPFLEGIQDIFSNWVLTTHNIVFNSFRSHALFALFLIGFIYLIKKRWKKLGIPLTIIFSIFALYVFKSGYFFYHHNYYMVPIIPVMAFVIGYGIYTIDLKIIYLIFFIGVMESIANQQNDFRIKPEELYKLTLKSKLDSLDRYPSRKLVLINTESNPQQLYLSNRKGCYINEHQMIDTVQLNLYRKKNYKWLIIDKNYKFKQPKLLKVYEDGNYIVFAL